MIEYTRKEVSAVSISERIRLIRESQPSGKLSRREFAERLGVSPGVIQNAEEAELRLKDGKIAESLLRNICSTYHVNYIWLTTGEGEMFRTPQPEERFRAFVEEHTPDESPYFKSLAVMAAKCWTDEQWALFRDFVEKLKANPDGEPESEE